MILIHLLSAAEGEAVIENNVAPQEQPQAFQDPNAEPLGMAQMDVNQNNDASNQPADSGEPMDVDPNPVVEPMDVDPSINAAEEAKPAADDVNNNEAVVMEVDQNAPVIDVNAGEAGVVENIPSPKAPLLPPEMPAYAPQAAAYDRVQAFVDSANVDELAHMAIAMGDYAERQWLNTDPDAFVRMGAHWALNADNSPLSNLKGPEEGRQEIANAMAQIGMFAPQKPMDADVMAELAGMNEAVGFYIERAGRARAALENYLNVNRPAEVKLLQEFAGRMRQARGF